MNIPFWKRLTSGGDSNLGRVEKFGRTTAPPTSGDSDPIWDYGGDFTYLTADTTLGVSSSSANDVMTTGSGAWTVEITGQDLLGNEICETVELNGTTKVETTNQFAIVYRVKCILPDSYTVKNDGDIYVYDTSDTVSAGVPQTAAKIQAKIPAGYGQTNMCIYRIPKGWKGSIKRIWGGLSSRAGVYGEIELFIRPDGEMFKNKWIKGITDSANFDIEVAYPDELGPLTDIQLRCGASSATNVSVSAGFDILLTK